ncbi:MAG: N-acetyl-gamma-glutamyl-phosphate reductase [Candidatus Dormibacteria bacterium]
MRAVVVGGSGYAGGELLRLLHGHPEFDVIAVSSERLRGKPLTAVHPHLRSLTGLAEMRFRGAADLPSADVLISALRHGETAARIDELDGLAPLVVDLSADFRLRNPDDYPRWYGWSHPRPELLESFVYGLPEVAGARLTTADHMAVGGCSATAAICALLPVVEARLLDLERPVVIDALIGSSAAGSEPTASSHHPHRSGAMRSYAATGHRHTAEILQELRLTDVALSVTSVEAVRGIHVSAHTWLREQASERDLWMVFRAAVASRPFLRIVKVARGLHREPDSRLVTGTNFCDIGFHLDHDGRHLVMTAAIDNLTKGAAGQAVHALNVRLGYPETTGLEFAGISPL